MGGIWGLAPTTALENLPVEARDLASGILQQRHAGGYLIAAVINPYLISHVGWRWKFRTSACVSASTVLLRIFLPESEVFLRAWQEKKPESTEPDKSKTRIFFREVGQILKKHSVYLLRFVDGRIQLPVPWLTRPLPNLSARQREFHASHCHRRNNYRKLWCHHERLFPYIILDVRATFQFDAREALLLVH